MRQVCWALIAAIALAACASVTATRDIALAQGDVIVMAPAGYCVATQASRPQDNFAILAPCTLLGAPGPIAEVSGLITVQIGPAGSGDITHDVIALRDFLITADGAALLSRRGQAGDITLRSTQAFDNQVMLHFSDRGPPPMAGLQGEEWRGFASHGGRLVTIAVRGLARAPLADGSGAWLLKQALAGIGPASGDP